MNEPVLTLDMSQLNELEKQLKGLPKKLITANRRMLARTEGRVKTELYRLIPPATTMSKEKLHSDFWAKHRGGVRLVSGRHEVSIRVVGKSLSLARFEHTPSENDRAAYPVKARVYRDGPLKVVGRLQAKKEKRLFRRLGNEETRLFSPFLAPAKIKNSGVPGPYIIFRRTGKRSKKSGKQAIESVRALAVPQMVVNPRIANPLLRALTISMDKTIAHEVDRHLQMMGKEVGRGKS